MAIHEQKMPIYPPDGFDLGGWVRRRRTDYLHNRLPQEKIQILQSQPKWVWNVLDAIWDENFENLLSYHKEHGHYMVPQSYKVSRDPKNLGAWVGTQMQNYEKEIISKERIAKLEALDGWYWSREEAIWEKAFSLLKKYYDEHKKMPSETFKTEQKFHLGNWLKNQRNGKDNLSQDQLRRLQELNFELKSEESPEEKWARFYKLLKDFFTENGHSSPIATYKIGNDNLGMWVVYQRQDKAELSTEKKKMLDAIEFDLWIGSLNGSFLTI